MICPDVCNLHSIEVRFSWHSFLYFGSMREEEGVPDCTGWTCLNAWALGLQAEAQGEGRAVTSLHF